MKRIVLTAAALSTAIPGSAFAGTLVLNTGYNYGTNGTLPVGAQDQTWIKIASYEPPTAAVAVAPAFVVSSSPWTPMPNAQWLAPRVSSATTSATSPNRPAYSIFRKCFCLLDTANAQINIQVRADDMVHVWMNTVTNTMVSPRPGNHSSGSPWPYPSLQQPANPQYFRVGRNCIYVLVEDNVAPAGHIGFALTGQVSAPGLMPNAATGVNGNFGACGCPTEPNSADVGHGTVGPGTVGHGTPAADQAEDSAAVQAIVTFAEARRLAHGEAPAEVAAPQP